MTAVANLLCILMVVALGAGCLRKDSSTPSTKNGADTLHVTPALSDNEIGSRKGENMIIITETGEELTVISVTAASDLDGNASAVAIEGGVESLDIDHSTFDLYCVSNIL